MGQVHFVACYYSAGCVADDSAVFVSREDAIAWCLDLCSGADAEDGGRIDTELRASGFAETREHKHDLYRVSVEKCTCGAPWEHEEYLTEDEWAYRAE